VSGQTLTTTLLIIKIGHVLPLILIVAIAILLSIASKGFFFTYVSRQLEHIRQHYRPLMASGRQNLSVRVLMLLPLILIVLPQRVLYMCLDNLSISDNTTGLSSESLMASGWHNLSVRVLMLLPRGLRFMTSGLLTSKVVSHRQSSRDRYQIEMRIHVYVSVISDF
jgi:hypothetical protein